MSVFDCSPPRFSDAELCAIAKTRFGLTGAIKRLDSERDQNALLRTPAGDFVLKVANVAEEKALIDLQNATLVHLAGADPDLRLPRLIPTVDGTESCEVPGTAGIHQVRLLTYLDGRPFSVGAAPFPELFEMLGLFMGRLSRALQSFEHPAANRPGFLWALDNAGACRPFTDDIVDADHRMLALQVFDRYEADIAPRLKYLRSGITHQDANENNVLVDETDPTKIAGLIDFGDMCRGRVINELAVTLAHALLEVPDVLSAATALMRGYCQAQPLQSEEIDVLFGLIEARLAMSVSISSNRSKKHPENPYLLVSQAAAFRLLKKLELLDQEYARSLFHDAACVPVFPESYGDGAKIAPEALLSRRRGILNPALSVSYQRPLTIIRGRGSYLYDHQGRRYLDCVNNIAHVGHCHPHVVAAIARQAGALNTNTRYLHSGVIEFAERITATLPDDLSVVTFVNSGTEANELALRMARVATGRNDVIVLDWGYHGNSSTTVRISPYKFQRAGGFPKPDDVEIAELPNPYRGAYRGMTADTGRAYARSVAECAQRIQARTGAGPACFIAESISGVGGQVVYPPGYLEAAYAAVRQTGGVCIADEVQCGFGRVGEAFWAFELQGVSPDIVVLGKPIGNGHPVAAVVTTRAIASAFANGMEYFNSFGGNPVSMAAGTAVLDVLEKERLPENACETGRHILSRVNEMAAQFELIGDVRGVGFFLGIELVRDRKTLEPASDEAKVIVNRLRDNCVLVSTEGPFDNVLKFKPPMVFRRQEADIFCHELESALMSFAVERFPIG
jgi:4-aminobutyrate aminotransferase-like enzyme/Ser/Thr protein kinase RdoA (MazF antagonist)